MANLAVAKPFRFIKESYSELKKVSWPTKQEATRLTLIVLAVSVIVGVYIGSLDFMFTKLFSIFLSR